MAECTFCEIVGGRVDAAVVADEPAIVAFLDQRPVFKGHVLVVPREHVDTMMDLDQGQLQDVFRAAQRVARAVEDGLDADGVFVAVNNRISQSVPHLHVHVVPRRRKDGLRGFFWPRQHYADDAEMHAYAGRIAAHLEPVDG